MPLLPFRPASRLWLSLCVPALGWSQGTSDGSITGPVLAHWFDPAARVVRPVTGVPGAALLDGTVPLEAALNVLAVAPQRALAVADTPDSDAALLVRWSRAGISTQVLPSELGRASRAVLSAAGTAAVLLHAKDARLQVWSGLTGTPTMARSLAAPAGEPRAFAISDDGAHVAAATTEGLFVASQDSSWRRLGEGALGLAFAQTGAKFAAVLPDGSGVRVWSGLGDEPVESLFLGGDQGVRDARAVAFSQEGDGIIVACADRLVLTATDGQGARTVETEFASTGVEPLRGTGTFLLRGEGELWLLDGEGDEPRLTRVPGVSAEVSR